MTLTQFLPPSLLEPLAIIPQETPVWLVGGAVRDGLLQIPCKDYDFVALGNARHLARMIANAVGGAYYDLDTERDMGRVLLSSEAGIRQTLDFSRVRGADIEEDLHARDFTINAMAIPLHGEQQLLDPLHGVKDLHTGMLRACSEGSVQADPIRGLRAVRMALRFDLRMTFNTLSQSRSAGPFLSAVSAERLRDEFFAMLKMDRPGRAMRLLNQLDLLDFILPELKDLKGLSQTPSHAMDAHVHTLAVLDRLADLLVNLSEEHDAERAADLVLAEAVIRLGRFRSCLRTYLDTELTEGRRIRELLYLAALMHDTGKPETILMEGGRVHFYGHDLVGAKLATSRAEALRLSRRESAWIGNIVRFHTQLGRLAGGPGVDARKSYRFFRDTGEVGVGVILHSLADLLAKREMPVDSDAWRARLDAARILLKARYEEPPEALNPIPLLRGDALAAALGISPGPVLGRLLESIREAQAAGEILTAEQAVSFAAEQLCEISNGKQSDG